MYPKKSFRVVILALLLALFGSPFLGASPNRAAASSGDPAALHQLVDRPTIWGLECTPGGGGSGNGCGGG